MDPDLGRFPVVWAAAGTDNAVFPVPPGTLRTLANATVAPIAETPEGGPATGPGAHAGSGSVEAASGLDGSVPRGAGA
jgi:hypothetical protein